MPASYPIMLDISNRRIVIIGGGVVAARKAAGLLSAGATNILVVAPQIDSTIPPAVERIHAEFDPKYLHGASLVFAATNNPLVNAEVTAAAHALGALVNRADSADTAPADFTTPAVHRAGPITLTVSTAGNPTLAALLRDQFAAQLKPHWVRLAEILTTLRPKILAANLPPPQTTAILKALATEEAASQAHAGADHLQRWIEQQFGCDLKIR